MVGGRLVLGDSGTISAAVFVTYILIFSQIIPPAKTFTTGYYSIQKGIASAERVFLKSSMRKKSSWKRQTRSVLTISGRRSSTVTSHSVIRLRMYSVMSMFVIPKGKIIALVGPSGSGKTTFVDLLPRFYDAVGGEILIDGIDIREYSINDLRSLMAMVTQESILFNDTVFQQYRLRKTDVSREAVIEAAKVANAHEFIMAMEEGYETNIGDRGAKLSGGQRQRLSIARAILRNPPILILDEATSALDSESERLVQDALLKVMKDRTSIVIAHRLSTIKFADEIMVLEKGTIVEKGNHEQLIKKGGLYKRLHDLQTFA